MAWLWESWEEYRDAVRPTMVGRPAVFRAAHRRSRFVAEGELWKALDKLDRATQALYDLGFGHNGRVPEDDEQTIDQAYPLLQEIIFVGETLLLYHKRLALSDASDGFLHQNDLLEHWNSYAQSGRIVVELAQVIEDVRNLVNGYHELAEMDNHFMVDKLDLPSVLESDFRLARNLFSLGFDEVGLLIAGRGLEGVLRQIASARKITLEVKGKQTPANESDFYDLIEIISQLRWKANGVRLIDTQTKALLHYLRVIRNSSAHPGRGTSSRPFGPRETTTLVAETANRLWKQVSATRARLDPTNVLKTW